MIFDSMFNLLMFQKLLYTFVSEKGEVFDRDPVEMDEVFLEIPDRTPLQ